MQPKISGARCTRATYSCAGDPMETFWTEISSKFILVRNSSGASATMTSELWLLSLTPAVVLRREC